MKYTYQFTGRFSLIALFFIAFIAPLAAQQGMALNANDLEQGSLTSSLSVGEFLIAASSDKTVTIDGNNKVAQDGSSFSQRIKLGGSGNAEYRSIHFSLSGPAEVTVYAMSSSSSSDRVLGLYTLDGSQADEMAAPGSGLAMHSFNLQAGDYYLASPSSGVNVYGVVIAPSGVSQAIERLDWAEVEAPVLQSLEQDGSSLLLSYSLVSGIDGADKAIISILDANGQVPEENLVGRSDDVQRSFSFTPESSGQYSFRMTAQRNDEAEGIESNTLTAQFSLPLTEPVVRAFTTADASLELKWTSVEEAQEYAVEYAREGSSDYQSGPRVSGTEATLDNLDIGRSYDLRVVALRGEDRMASQPITKLVQAREEREWAFTYFGQSTNAERNSFEMIDDQNLEFLLNSATIRDDGINIQGKGGKFTEFHDGISFYYTVIDPETENFSLTATFTVEFINPTPDGQEGFGLLVLDSLGEYGVSSVNHYTNSAAVLATKMEETIDGIKYTSKDALGTRFVTGITPEVLSSGDSAIAENAVSTKSAFSYAPEDLIVTGGQYTLTLRKTNTGYHASIAGEDERILYGVDKLLQIDGDHLYLGFAAARGCNVRVSDVQFSTSNPAEDAPAVAEPAQEVNYTAKIDSPDHSSQEIYNFVYTSSVPGSLSIADSQGNILADNLAVTASEDVHSQLQLSAGENRFTVSFTPQAGYTPGDNQVLASYETRVSELNVEYRSFAGSQLAVSSEGLSSGDGSAENPLDIYTAVKFCRPGQRIELAPGTYMLSSPLVISRGNDGTPDQYKMLSGGGEAVLDFSQAGGGMSVWGSYWLIEGIDITNTAGNIKGLQIAGHYNVVNQVNAYANGDTGIQISGTSAETFEKWPSYNLVINSSSWDNMDPGMNNADGFAAKLTVGEGNVFDGCIAHHNLDDGWDLFAKISTGPIGAVTIRNCIAYGNGTLTNGVGDGDGNGFKLGGDGIAVPHVLENSIAYGNNHAGITSNSNPAIIVRNTTSVDNGSNYRLYGKGDGQRQFVVERIVSIGGAEADDFSEMPELAGPENFFDGGNGRGTNSLGDALDASIFEVSDSSMAPGRQEDGALDMQGLFEIIAPSAGESGAHLEGHGYVFQQSPAEYDEGTSASTRYQVVSGDYLRKLSARFYGDEMLWHRIYDANENQIENPDLIYTGQVFVIP